MHHPSAQMLRRGVAVRGGAAAARAVCCRSGRTSFTPHEGHTVGTVGAGGAGGGCRLAALRERGSRHRGGGCLSRLSGAGRGSKRKGAPRRRQKDTQTPPRGNERAIRHRSMRESGPCDTGGRKVRQGRVRTLQRRGRRTRTSARGISEGTPGKEKGNRGEVGGGKNKKKTKTKVSNAHGAGLPREKPQTASWAVLQTERG